MAEFIAGVAVVGRETSDGRRIDELQVQTDRGPVSIGTWPKSVLLPVLDEHGNLAARITRIWKVRCHVLVAGTAEDASFLEGRRYLNASLESIIATWPEGKVVGMSGRLAGAYVSERAAWPRLRSITAR